VGVGVLEEEFEGEEGEVEGKEGGRDFNQEIKDTKVKEDSAEKKADRESGEEVKGYRFWFTGI